MIPYLTIALAVCSLFATAYMNFVRPARRRARAAALAVAAEPEPELRVPRDLDRQYPRPKGGRRKLDKTCPACGTGAETTALNGKILGWPAHASCAEWLGEHWRPARPVPPPYKPDMELIGHIERGGYGAGNLTASELPPPPSSVSVRSRTNTVHCAGGTVLTIGNLTGVAGGSGNLDSMALTNDVAAVIRRQIADGHVTVDEARERIISAFGVPGPALGDAVDEAALGHLVALQEMFLDSEMRATANAIEQRCKVPGKPAITEFCTCGMKFTGTPEWIGMRLDVHRASGACPHSVKGRAADLRDLDGR